jgi:hypothetical protein
MHFRVATPIRTILTYKLGRAGVAYASMMIVTGLIAPTKLSR